MFLLLAERIAYSLVNLCVERIARIHQLLCHTRSGHNMNGLTAEAVHFVESVSRNKVWRRDCAARGIGSEQSMERWAETGIEYAMNHMVAKRINQSGRLDLELLKI